MSNYLLIWKKSSQRKSEYIDIDVAISVSDNSKWNGKKVFRCDVEKCKDHTQIHLYFLNGKELFACGFIDTTGTFQSNRVKPHLSIKF